MNLTLLWLLFNGKLAYLRNGWIKTQGIDPAWDYVNYCIKSTTYLTFGVVASICAGVGFGGFVFLSFGQVLDATTPQMPLYYALLVGTLATLGPLGMIVGC